MSLRRGRGLFFILRSSISSAAISTWPIARSQGRHPPVQLSSHLAQQDKIEDLETVFLDLLVVGLVIATASFPQSAAVTATLVYGLFGVIGSLAIALCMGRISSLPSSPEELQDPLNGNSAA
jgi:hypothetical protein